MPAAADASPMEAAARRSLLAARRLHVENRTVSLDGSWSPTMRSGRSCPTGESWPRATWRAFRNGCATSGTAPPSASRSASPAWRWPATCTPPASWSPSHWRPCGWLRQSSSCTAWCRRWVRVSTAAPVTNRRTRPPAHARVPPAARRVRHARGGTEELPPGHRERPAGADASPARRPLRERGGGGSPQARLQPRAPARALLLPRQPRPRMRPAVPLRRPAAGDRGQVRGHHRVGLVRRPRAGRAPAARLRDRRRRPRRRRAPDPRPARRSPSPTSAACSRASTTRRRPRGAGETRWAGSGRRRCPSQKRSTAYRSSCSNADAMRSMSRRAAPRPAATSRHCATAVATCCAMLFASFISNP